MKKVQKVHEEAAIQSMWLYEKNADRSMTVWEMRGSKRFMRTNEF